MEKTPSFLMNEVLSQITEITRLMCNSISWKIEEDIEQSVESLCEGTMEVPTVRFDVGQLMQWPDMNSAGVMICGFMLESEMFSHGSARCEAAKSEMFTPVFAGGGGVVAEAGPMVVAKAVTSRVSALPTVGSDIQTDLSAAAGGEDRLCLSSGDVLDNVGHGAGRSDARMVPVEHLLLFGEVHNVVLSWMRPVVVLTSKFFLSDEGEDVEMPLHINDGRPVRQRKVYFSDVDKCPQMTEGIHGVGPTGDRWDGQRILDTWCKLCKWMNTQLWDPENGLGVTSGQDTVRLGTGIVTRSVQYPVERSILRGSPCSRRLGDETGSVGRNGQYKFDADWLDGHPNRRGSSVITGTDATVAQYCRYIKGIPTKDWALSNRPAVWNDVLEYPPVLVNCSNDTDRTWIVFRCVWLYKLLAGRIEMPSGNFLKSVSESNLDKLYDLPESIQDVMGLQALRPSAAVMTIPDSNCVRIVTPDEHVPTGFHKILIYDMGQEDWPKVPMGEIGCLRLDWPKDLFSFVGRYQLELEHMRKECRDRFGGISSGTCPTCEKFIQVNLGKHVALYHLDLAQLWRCPVGWCPVWKGTSQDCVNHMRRAHNTPISVKAGNLARWFPPWTVPAPMAEWSKA